MQKQIILFSFSRLLIFLTFFSTKNVVVFVFCFPDFSLPFSRLFTSVFPTFYFRFPDFSLPEVKRRENGSEKSGKQQKKNTHKFF